MQVRGSLGVLVLIYALAAQAAAWATPPRSTHQETSPTITATPPGASWLGDAQRELAQREYHASVNDLGLQAPNRNQGFRTYFDEQGIRLVARSADSEPWAAIEFIGYGRQQLASNQSGQEQDIQELGLAEVESAAAQVTLAWPEVTASYDNNPGGLQQIITLHERLPGSQPLSIVLAISDAILHINGDVAELRGSSSLLQLGSIRAQDAQGRGLPVVLAVEGDRLLMIVDDEQGEYPITLQSILTNTSEAVLESNQVSASLGTSVAGAGDVNGDGYADVIVGAPLFDNGQDAEGAAFLYFGGAGALDLTADAHLESNQASAFMGISVAGAGDVNGDGYADVIVGAQQYDNGQDAEGAAFLYFGGAGAFDLTPDAQLESNQELANLGRSVAGAGDVNGDGYADVIVGAYFYHNGQDAEGAAFLYFGGAGTFDTTADAQLESNQESAQMGRSVAGAGDVNGDGYADLIVGALLYDNGQSAEGAAFLYFGGAGAFNTVADAQLESNQVDARLGISVAGAGDVNGDGYADVIVGADLYDNGEDGEGAAFLYFGGAGAFNLTPDAHLESNQASAQMGWSVAGAGDVNGDGYADVIVGAHGYGDGQNAEGAAFVYFGGAGAFDQTPDAQLESNQVSASLGVSVAGAGDVNGDGYADVIVGANGYDNGQDGEGAAFVYFGGAGAFNTVTDAQLESNQENAQMGISVAGAGDVNGDGYADLIVGAVLYDNGQSAEGAAFLYFGGAGAFNLTPDAQLESNQVDAHMGVSVAGAGDVNGDGYADVIVGADFYDNGQTDEGAAFVYFGGAGAFNLTPDAHLESNQAGASQGISVAGAGDVNGDGYADVIVGAYFYDNGQDAEGAAFLWFGGAGAFDTTADAQLESNQENAQMGFSVAGAGDVNGDGYADVIVGAWLYDNGENAEGSAFLYFGGAGAFNQNPDAQLESNQEAANLGVSVAGAGDVNGDGYADVIVGAYGYDNGQDGEGAAFVYFGGAGAFDQTHDAQLESNQESAALGISVASAGDVNGDGYADVIVGAFSFDNGHDAEGAAFVYLGGAGAFNQTADAQLESNQEFALIGVSVAGAGDVNGDGYADVIVGAQGYDNGQNLEGAAFLYFGGAAGRLVLARQYRDGGASPVQPWGLTQQSDGFTVKLNATSPRGRERARLQLEACPNGVSFGSLLCDNYTAGTWTEIGANSQGSNLALSATGLTVDRLYHWRARVQYAPLTVTAPGVTSPPIPMAGPWRRLQANGDVADIRTNAPVIEIIFADGFE